jgi:hypothetical protein
MGFLDPKPLTPGALDAAMTGKINDAASGVRGALNAAIDAQGVASVGNGLSAWWTALLAWFQSLFIPAVVIFPTSNVAAKLAEAATAGLDAVFTPGTYTVPSGGWTWEATRHSLLAAGNVVFNATALTTGAAITVRGNDGRDYLVHDFMQATHRMQGIRINLPTSDATTVDGIVIQDVGAGSRGNSHVNLENIIVTHGRDQVFLGDNTWCVRFVNVFFNKAHRYGVNCDSGLNAGENYTFLGGTIAGAHNASGTAIGFYTTTTGNVDAYFFGTSFDYSDCDISHNSGIITANGCHFEGNNSSGPMVKLSYTPGSERTSFNMFGGVLAPTEAVTTRVSLIDCVTGNAIYVGLHEVKTGVWDKELEADLVRVISGLPTVRVIGGDLQTGGSGKQTFPGQPLQKLYNGGFDNGNLNGWSQGGIVTYTSQTAVKYSGTHALKMAGGGTVGSSFVAQTFDCEPGNHVFVGTQISSDTMTAGNVVLVVRFYAADGTTIISSQTLATVTANQAWTKYRNRYTAPAGTRTVQFRVLPTDLNGNVYVDECYAAVT